MIATVERFGHGKDSTVGVLTVPGAGECYTLEDEGREVKVKGETRIPAGKYRVTLRTVGGFHERYKKRFPDFHQGMLWLRDVPGFEFILIHCGNTDEDTEGCILVGEGYAESEGEYTLSQSVLAYKRIYPPLAATAADGDLWVKVSDG